MNYHPVTQNFINAISGKPSRTYIIHSTSERDNGSTYATLDLAISLTEVELKSYTSSVIDGETGEVLHFHKGSL